MTNIRSIDMLLLDDIFEMNSGYVLNFSDRTFSQFFREELAVNIYDPKFSQNGGSKAKRLRYFLQSTDKSLAAKALNALWEYREIVAQIIEMLRLKRCRQYSGASRVRPLARPRNSGALRHQNYQAKVRPPQRGAVLRQEGRANP
jgi:hypothetical protein